MVDGNWDIVRVPHQEVHATLCINFALAIAALVASLVVDEFPHGDHPLSTVIAWGPLVLLAVIAAHGSRPTDRSRRVGT